MSSWHRSYPEVALGNVHGRGWSRMVATVAPVSHGTVLRQTILYLYEQSGKKQAIQITLLYSA
eukprot:4671682-Amphidinium_carterae.1